jgi:GTPase
MATKQIKTATKNNAATRQPTVAKPATAAKYKPHPPAAPAETPLRTGRRRGFRSGFVSVLGQPNAGKSTLVNAFAGQKVAIVSSKPQTTRNTLQAIVSGENSQIVFIDTPGIHTSPSLLHQRMMDSVRSAASGQDLLIWLADATQSFEKTSQGLGLLKNQETPAILVANKIDRLKDKRQLLPLLESYGKAHPFQEYLPISALTGVGLEELEAAIIARLPKGPPLFPEDQLTDAPERFLAAELIREKILTLTGEEVPHAAAIVIEQWEETPRLLKIGAAIHIEREGQKRIIIGKGGAMLREIGSQTRAELEENYQKKVFLELFVKVQPGWRESAAFLAELDWRSE